MLDLWDTIDPDEAPISDAQKQELERRLALAEKESASGEDWDTLKAKLLRGEF